MTYYIYFIALIAYIFLIFLFAIYFIWSITFGVPFVPSGKKEIDSILAFLRSTKVKTIAELGAGNGRIAFRLAEKGYIVKAVEINPLLTVAMRIWKALRRYKNVEIINQDLYKTDVKDIDAVIVYLFPSLIERLEKKLFNELDNGSYIISNTFRFKNRKPIIVIGKVYIYKVAR